MILFRDPLTKAIQKSRLTFGNKEKVASLLKSTFKERTVSFISLRLSFFSFLGPFLPSLQIILDDLNGLRFVGLGAGSCIAWVSLQELIHRHERLDELPRHEAHAASRYLRDGVVKRLLHLWRDVELSLSTLVIVCLGCVESATDDHPGSFPFLLPCL